MAEQPIVKLGKHVLLTQGQMEAAPSDYPPELKALGKELVTNGAGLWASQNRYGNCPPTTWYPDPRIVVAISLSLFQLPGVCLGHPRTEPPPDRDWAKYIAGAKLSPYYVGDKPDGEQTQARPARDRAIQKEPESLVPPGGPDRDGRDRLQGATLPESRDLDSGEVVRDPLRQLVLL